MTEDYDTLVDIHGDKPDTKHLLGGNELTPTTNSNVKHQSTSMDFCVFDLLNTKHSVARSRRIFERFFDCRIFVC